MVTSLKSLLKLLEVSQLSPRLGGTLSHSHCDWLELHQVRPSARAFARSSTVQLLELLSCPRLETLPVCV